MKNVKERIAYLQGLAQGIELEETSREGQVLSGIIDVLEQMADQLEDIEVAQDDLEEYVESIDEDLSDLEGEFFGDDLGDRDLIEVKCSGCGEIVCFEPELAEDEDLIEVTCPNCDEVVYVNDQDILNGTNDDNALTGRKEEDF